MAEIRGEQDVTKLKAEENLREANEKWKEHVKKARKRKKMKC